MGNSPDRDVKDVKTAERDLENAYVSFQALRENFVTGIDEKGVRTDRKSLDSDQKTISAAEQTYLNAKKDYVASQMSYHKKNPHKYTMTVSIVNAIKTRNIEAIKEIVKGKSLYDFYQDNYGIKDEWHLSIIHNYVFYSIYYHLADLIELTNLLLAFYKNCDILKIYSDVTYLFINKNIDCIEIETTDNPKKLKNTRYTSVNIHNAHPLKIARAMRKNLNNVFALQNLSVVIKTLQLMAARYSNNQVLLQNLSIPRLAITGDNKINIDVDRDDQPANSARLICSICMNHESDTFIQNCGHICACKGCLSKVRECPVCRTKITGFSQAYVI